jgi:glyoxylase-like metal-dependent hydrolase (beta-lactamase superfamily II)
MTPTETFAARRRRLRSALLGALFVLTAPFASAHAAEPAALPFTLKPIGTGVYAVINGPEGKAGSNAGFVIGDDGVLVIDALGDEAAARALLGEIRKLTQKPIRYVVNTHYHLDHTSGDGVFRQAGAIIIAHRNVRGWIRTNNLNLIGDQAPAELKAKVAELALPDLVTTQPLTVWLGSRRINIQPLEGHTGGDLTVGIPDAKVIFCGDLLWGGPANIIDGTVSKWIETLALFQKLPDAPTMTFIPGHGDVAKVKDVAYFQAYLVDLSKFTAEARGKGLTGDAEVADVLPKLMATHPDWPNLSRPGAKMGVVYMDQELAGTKRVPKPE